MASSLNRGQRAEVFGPAVMEEREVAMTAMEGRERSGSDARDGADPPAIHVVTEVPLPLHLSEGVDSNDALFASLGGELFGDELGKQGGGLLAESLVSMEAGSRVLVSLSDIQLVRHVSVKEQDIFKRHTWWPGLFFRTLRMERTFVDGHARLHKNEVYIGYCAIIVVTILASTAGYLKDWYQDTMCPPYAESECSDGGTNMALILILNYQYILKYIFPVHVGVAALGSFLNWYIHRSKRIKEKSWALLVVFVLYFLVLVYQFGILIHVQNFNWPTYLMRASFLLLSVYVFFSGAPNTITFLLLWLAGIIIMAVAYPVTHKMLDGQVDKELVLKTTFTYSMYWVIIISSLYLVGSYLGEIASRKMFLQRILMANQQQEIIKEKTRTTELQKTLLHDMLPESIIEQLRMQNFTIQSWDQLRRMSCRHSGVCIMFGELDGFTAFSAQVRPSLVMEYLNDLFLVFDGLCDDYDVYKVETVGDQYVAAVGVVTGKMHNEEVDQDDDDYDCNVLYSNTRRPSRYISLKDASLLNTKQMLGFAKAIVDGSRRVNSPEGADVCPRLRVGIHTGTCMSGIVGTRNFRFCLFGDTMNTAARMEQKSVADCIHTTQDVVDLVSDECWEKLKKIDFKGKGLMQTYLLRVMSDENVDESKAEVNIATLHDKNQILNDDDDDAETIVSESSESNESLRVSAFDSINDASTTSAYQDVQPVSDGVYREHTVCFGLFFRKMHIERSYLDGQARLDKTMVYFGYFLYVLVLSLNYLYGYLKFHSEYALCKDPRKRRSV